MRLYFLRHGHAEYRDGIDDHERRLTTQGVRVMSIAANVLASMGIAPRHIYSSPRVRAVQTAEIVAAALEMDVEQRDEVNFPNFGVQAVEALIADLGVDDEVMFVGHEPSLSTVVGELTGASVKMKKGGLARVDLTDRSRLRGALIWLLAPKVYDALAGD